MDYQQMDEMLSESAAMQQYETREAFLKAVGKAPARITGNAADVHDKIAQILEGIEGELPPFPEFSAQEREYRHELSVRAHDAILARIADIRYTYLDTNVSQNYRYVRDLMCETYHFPEIGEEETDEMRAYNRGVREHNARTLDVMTHMKEHRSDAISLVTAQFRKLQDADPFGLVDHKLTDEEIVNNFERIHLISATGLQIQNFFQDMEANGIRLDTMDERLTELKAKSARTQAEQTELDALERDVAQLKECHAIADRYHDCANEITALEKRMGQIESPYYEILDYDNQNVQTAFCLISKNESRLDFDLDDPISTDESFQKLNRAAAGMSRFNKETGLNSSIVNARASNEAYFAQKQLEEAGVAPENIVFDAVVDSTEEEIENGEPAKKAITRSIGKFGDQVGSAAERGEFTKTRIYDSAHPEHFVDIDVTTAGRLFQQAAVSERGELFPPHLPTPPQPVEKPVHPISNWKAFWNFVTAGNAYKAEYEAFNNGGKARYEQEQRRYTRYTRELKTYQEELARVTRYREQYVAKHPEDTAAAKALKQQSPAAIAPAALAPVAAKARQFTLPQESNIPSNVFDAVYAQPNMAGESGVAEEEVAAFTKSLFTSLNTCCSLQLGTAEQSRLLYLTDSGHLRSCEKMDVFATADQTRLTALLRSNRLFAIPAGETTPVQVQLADKDDPNSIRYADNLGCPPKEPNVNRFWARLTGSGRDQLNAYKSALLQSARAASIRDEIDRITAERAAQGFERRALTGAALEKGSAAETEVLVHSELALGEELTSHQLHRFDEAETARKRAIAETVSRRDEASFGVMRRIYGAKPVFEEDWKNRGCYSAEAFRQLTPYELSLLPADAPSALDENGRLQLNEDAFASLAIGAVATPELSPTMIQSAAKDKAVIASEQKSAYQARLFCPELTFDMFNSMIRNDMVMREDRSGAQFPRENLSFFFQDSIQPARALAAEAITQYRQGNLQPMARIIAYSLMEFDRSSKTEPFTGVANRMVDKAYAIQVEMIEKDPALKEAVKKEAEAAKEKAGESIIANAKARAAIRNEHPYFEECRDLQIASSAGSKEKAAFNDALKAHPDYPELLLKDGALAINTDFATHAHVFDLDKAITRVHARQAVGDIFADAKVARDKAEIARLEGRALTPEEKHDFLKATLKAELLLRHDKEFRRMSESSGVTPPCQSDKSILAAANAFPGKMQLQNEILADLNGASMFFVPNAVNDTFSPLYVQLGKAENASETVGTFVDAFVSPEKQDELCALPDADFLSSLQSPCSLFNENDQKIADEAHTMFEKTKEAELIDLTDFSDEPVPDGPSSTNAPAQP